MAEKIVISLIVKLGTRLEKEVKLDNKIRTDIKCIKDELQMILPILRAADATKEINADLRVWLQQVRDAASSSEDVFDELMYYLGCPSKSHSIEKFQARHRIDSAIRRMRREYKDISERGKRYQSLSSNIISSNHGQVISDPQEDALFKTDADLVGIDGTGGPKERLLELLLEKTSHLRIIPVVGMGGIGKSTLVKQIYDDAKVKSLFQSHAWIRVSQNVKLEALLKDLIRQLCSEIKKPFPGDVESMNYTQLKQRVHDELLKDRKYAIVVDDVWSIEAWQAIKNLFPENHCGSRVIITTRKTDVASESCKYPQSGSIFTLDPLSAENMLKLLCKIVFSGEPCPVHLLDDSKGILKKCAGLPLAVVAISGVLINKDKVTNAVWSKINRKLAEELEDNKELKNIEIILSLSYYDLPHYLKTCFLHMGIFPEDYLIGRRRLIRMWIAEGFSDEKVDERHTAEDVAKGYLKELLSRNLIQAAERRSDGMIKSYQIHDLFMELIRKKSREHNFATVRKANSVTGLGNVYRLSTHKTSNTEGMKNIHLVRSFMIFDAEESLTKISMPTLFSRAFKLLVVLDMQGANLDQFPTCVTGLFNLRYLSLKDTQVASIPSSIGNLQRLETLDLKGTPVSELPTEIQGLTQLRNLLVYRNRLDEVMGFHSKSGFVAPKRIGCLESLRVLCFVEASHRNNNVICEVGKLTALRRLGIVKLTTKHNSALCTSISRLSNLHALSITSSESETINLQGLTAPVTSLRRLYLTGKLESSPLWLQRFEKLVKIFLKSSNLSTDPLETLERLPHLVHIELSKVYDGEVLIFKAGKFLNLKNLGLHRLESLQRVIMEQTAMPSLERFILQGCPMLKILPCGIEHLSQLKVLDLVYMPEELIAVIQASPKHPGPDYSKVRHIPEVNSIYKIDGVVDTSRLNYNEVDTNGSSDRHTAEKLHSLNKFLVK
ncbi:unnamed protein product [Rhodiola kirilowii]